MKPKTKAFVDLTLANPKLSNTEAYLMTHETTSKATARANASELMSKPAVQIYKQAHVNKAKNKIVELVGSNREDIALKASESILDRELGKPLARTNSLNLNVNLEDALNNLV